MNIYIGLEDYIYFAFNEIIKELKLTFEYKF